MKDNAEMTREELIALGWIKKPSDKMQEKAEKQLTAVEWLINEIDMQYPEINVKRKEWMIDKAKEMEKEQRGYTESDMRSYASYILNNPVIEPSQWYKIYRNKSE